MKKILSLGLLTVCLAASEQTASAWVNAKFGIGLNWNWQSGGNNFLWGLFRNGQPPGPGCDPCFGGGMPFPGGPGGPMGPMGCPGGGPVGFPGAPFPAGGHFPGFIPSGAIYGPQDFQYFGRQPYGQPNNGTEANQQYANPASYRTSAYYPYYNGVRYAPANGNGYWNPSAYSFGVNVGR